MMTSRHGTLTVSFNTKFDFGGLFNLGGEPKEKNLRSEPKYDVFETYKVPEERASGRPHNLGWVEKLSAFTPFEGKGILGQVPPGTIIMEED